MEAALARREHQPGIRHGQGWAATSPRVLARRSSGRSSRNRLRHAGPAAHLPTGDDPRRQGRALVAGLIGGAVRALTRPDISWTRRIGTGIAGAACAGYGTPVFAP